MPDMGGKTLLNPVDGATLISALVEALARQPPVSLSR